MLLLVSAISIGLSFGLYRENARLKENDIKFRMIRQSLPKTARWADTTYHRDPESIERVLKKLEAEQKGMVNDKAGVPGTSKRQGKLFPNLPLISK